MCLLGHLLVPPYLELPKPILSDTGVVYKDPPITNHEVADAIFKIPSY